MAANSTQTLRRISTLHSQASTLLRPLNRTPTRAEYAEALMLADEALELATTAVSPCPTSPLPSPPLTSPSGSSCSESADDHHHVLETCRALQTLCLDSLRCASRSADIAEREKYERSRAGVECAADKEGCAAGEEGRGSEGGKRIRWADRVKV
ncbi:hypothetical protein F4810DRAFT_706735 [Camillea tinctor]|nr:hypothetical protein F4810DRAFT_706735 [Camillea tinctor]